MCSDFYLSIRMYVYSPLSRVYVTVHDKTNHIAAKMIFELRRPLPKSTFELRLEKI